MTVLKNTVVFVLASIALIAGGVTALNLKTKKALAPQPAVLVLEAHSPEFQTAFFEASRIYGKAGCGDQSLSEMTARASLDSGLPANLIAAQVAVESTCNPVAVSNRGAIGLMQVVPKTWSKQYDFSKINLLNPKDNMKAGTGILAALVKQYGVKNALVRYYGLGSDGEVGLGGIGYAERVYQMAGIK